MPTEPILALRLGVTTHVSPLRRKFRRLMAEYPIGGAEILEDWMLEVANVRGASVVSRSFNSTEGAGDGAPSRELLSNAELVAGICQPHNRDRPQWLRVAAQLVTGGDIDLEELELLAVRERVGRILAELARQALRVNPDHPVWQRLSRMDEGKLPLRDTLVHWTRLAEPVMEKGKPGAAGWRLVG